MEQNSFPGKLLLFGEYTVLDGGRALAVPAPLWSGHWVEKSATRDQSLTDLARFLYNNDLSAILHIQTFADDVEAGLMFESNIPVGYGVGSSGALAAAVYHRYGKIDNTIHTDLEKLRGHLAQIESCFHGKSSGIDPLISFTKKAILQELGTLRAVDMQPADEVHILLIDSGIARKTDLLVNRYKEMKDSTLFVESCIRPLNLAVEHAIAFYLMRQPDIFWEQLGIISTMQRRYFVEMIPPGIKKLWDRALNSDIVKLKLCGAGGGGYFLAFTRDIDQAKDILQCEVIEV